MVAVPTIISSLLITITITITMIMSSTTISSSPTSMNTTTTSLFSPPPRNQNLIMAIEEMQKANYFTFVMLINMSPIDPAFLDNVTFLMPKDRTLSETAIPGHAVPEFLRRHAVPTPLLVDDLLRIPTGSVLPSLDPVFPLAVSNYGRRNFSLNNVRIVSPNICVAGYSIRCHGVDGVMQETVREEGDNTTTSSGSSNTNCSSNKAAAAPPPTASVMQPPQPSRNPPGEMAAPVPASEKDDRRKSGGISCGGSLEVVGISCSIMLLML